MWFEDYKWHYDYVRLAWDTGFAFEKCKSATLDKNKICVVDVDRIVRERDVASVDHNISTVVQYILDEEQAKVLDTNFVKIFRISQLAVEYLLFCKKYLDNTVVLLKKELAKNRDENKELKLLIEDLQAHVDTLTRQQIYTTFKCSSCAKIFSSEDYLNAHVKRRHSGSEHYNSETEKLNTEIKELKERLNNTEKLLKDKGQESPKKITTENTNDTAKMCEISEKFEKFKNQVDDELRELRMQKSFYEENYGKLFEIVIQNKENLEPKSQTQGIPRMETTTQTDKLLQIENVNFKNITEIRDISPPNDSVDGNPPKKSPNHAKKESLESRITTTLAGIEDQMQAFWGKLNEIEQHKTSPGKQAQSSTPGEYGDNTMIKPKAKPRSKLSQPTHISSNTTGNAEKLKRAIGELEEQQKEAEVKRIEVKKSPVKNVFREATRVVFEKDSLARPSSSENTNSEGKTYSVSEDSDTEEEDSETPIQKTTVLVRKAKAKSPQRSVAKKTSRNRDMAAILEKHSPVSARKKVSSKTTNYVNKDIEMKLVNRLQELGISEHWSRLPQRSFDKAMEIINHQATLTKKAHPNFYSIKKKIMKNIDKMCYTKKAETEIDSPKLEAVQNIVRVSCRTKTKRKQSDYVGAVERKPLEIKNRSLYETDTESDQTFQQRNQSITNKTPELLARYSNVVAEIKSLSNIKSSTEDSLDDISKDPQRGVLKSFPSAGSLSKKKVLFDLEEDSSKTDEVPVLQKTGGSTTSIASSILEDKVATDKDKTPKESNNDIEKELDELSDFELSEL